MNGLRLGGAGFAWGVLSAVACEVVKHPVAFEVISNFRDGDGADYAELAKFQLPILR